MRDVFPLQSPAAASALRWASLSAAAFAVFAAIQLVAAPPPAYSAVLIVALLMGTLIIPVFAALAERARWKGLTTASQMGDAVTVATFIFWFITVYNA